MAILKAALCLVLAGCYAPNLPDCRVACAADEDCAPGQSCGAEGLCTGHGTCSTDGARSDARPEDALELPDAPPDAATGILRIKLVDQGTVTIPGHPPCDPQTSLECSYIVPLGIPITLDATPLANRVFETWQEACTGAIPSCTLVPVDPETDVTAKFHKDDGNH